VDPERGVAVPCAAMAAAASGVKGKNDYRKTERGQCVHLQPKRAH
jgi:hypothetical protein